MEIIGRGAEAILIKKKNSLIKHRIKKNYRHPDLDTTIIKRRTKRESKILQKLQTTINVPKVTKTTVDQIQMEYINGKVLSENLDKLTAKKQNGIAKQLAESISKLHQNNIIHGDLTTSNMILKNNKIYFIDFGLSFHSTKTEDKAVDIHLLREALNSKHFKIADKFFKIFTKTYSKKQGKEALKRLEVVEKRGRYKQKGML